MDLKIPLLHLLLIYTTVSATTKPGCDPNVENHCTCFSYTEIEYQCPKTSPDSHVNVKYFSEKSTIVVECGVNRTINSEQLPRFNFSTAESLMLKYCPIGDLSFLEVANMFGINQLKNLSFELTPSDDDLYLNKEKMKGLNGLEKLTVGYTNLHLDDDFLEELPNLKILHLKQNKIKKIGHIFRNNDKLRKIDLSVNYLEELPDFVFKNLENLEVLTLWNNRLTTLNKNTFSGLKKLKLLELMNNKLENISQDAFADLQSLEVINLSQNKLKNVPKNLFQHNSALTKIRLGLNDLSISFPDFKQLPNLEIVELSRCKLNSLPDDLFNGSYALKDINLSENNIEYLPDTIFSGLNKIVTLNLHSNKITYIPDNAFIDLKNLEILKLSANKLSSINQTSFEGLKSVQVLELSHNNLRSIPSRAFESMDSVKVINLSHNEINFNAFAHIVNTPFNGCCLNLATLDMSYNNITQFPAPLITAHMSTLKMLNLSRNHIQYLEVSDIIPSTINIDLSFNDISYVGMRHTIISAKTNNISEDNKNSYPVKLTLDSNPINCDCHNLELSNYINTVGDYDMVKQFVDISLKDVQCPIDYLERLKPGHMTCSFVNDGCPDVCDCIWRPSDKSITVNCFNRGLTKLPVINLNDTALEENGYFYNQTLIQMSANKLPRGPYEGEGYDNVTELDLSFNEITEVSWVPPKIEVMRLQGNRLKGFDVEVIDMLKSRTSLRSMNLHYNPWRCDCSALPLQSYLRDNGTEVGAIGVKCDNSDISIVNNLDICETYLIEILSVSFSLLLLFSIFGILFYIYELEIKVWLYAKNLCLWFVNEEELDKDKEWDVFISYSNNDADFVWDKLLPNLENIPDPFKVNVHDRTFVPGELIDQQISNAVQISRRTLIVLTNNFLESLWGQLEFQMAHSQALRDGRNRVIILIYGNIDESLLNDELKSYMKTNTYIRWDDPWFWQKLRYALPHKKVFKKHQRHTNMMLKIDDKFELCKSSNPEVSSTPPAVTLDPAKLLPFQDGEAPLMKPRDSLVQVKVV